MHYFEAYVQEEKSSASTTNPIRKVKSLTLTCRARMWQNVAERGQKVEESGQKVEESGQKVEESCRKGQKVFLILAYSNFEETTQSQL
jgi:hypothetical protein